MTSKATTDARDSAQLEALGYDSKFDRSMSLWSNFALGFTYLSPVVGVYTVFAFAIATGGPPMFWSYLFVGLGQLLVALVFGAALVVPASVAGAANPSGHGLPSQSCQDITAAGGRVIETGKPAQSGGTPSVMLTLVGETV